MLSDSNGKAAEGPVGVPNSGNANEATQATVNGPAIMASDNNTVYNENIDHDVNVPSLAKERNVEFVDGKDIAAADKMIANDKTAQGPVAISKDNMTIEGLSEMLSKLMNDDRALRNKQHSEMDEKMNAMKARIDQIEEENKSLKANFVKVEAENKSLKADITKLEEQVSKNAAKFDKHQEQSKKIRVEMCKDSKATNEVSRKLTSYCEKIPTMIRGSVQDYCDKIIPAVCSKGVLEGCVLLNDQLDARDVAVAKSILSGKYHDIKELRKVQVSSWILDKLVTQAAQRAVKEFKARYQIETGDLQSVNGNKIPFPADLIEKFTDETLLMKAIYEAMDDKNDVQKALSKVNNGNTNDGAPAQKKRKTTN